MSAPAKRILAWLALAVILAAGWELLAKRGFLQGRWPHIGDVGWALLDNWKELAMSGANTVLGVLAALAIGILVGVPLGILVAGKGAQIMYEMLASAKAIPVTVLIPLFLGMFGLTRFIVPLVSLPLVLNFAVNTSQAVEQTNQTRKLLLQSWSVPHRVYVRHVLPFECLDSLLQTARIMIPFAFALHVALDYFLATPNGLGDYVREKSDYREWGAMYAGVLCVAAIGWTAAMAIDKASKELLRWKRDM